RRPRHLLDAQHLHLHLRDQLGGQLGSSGAAERLVRPLETALLILGELAGAREVDLANASRPPRPRRLLAGRGLALLRRFDQRRDLIVRQDVAAHAALRRLWEVVTRSSSVPPADLQVTRPSLRYTRIVRPLDPPVAAPRTGMRCTASAARTASSLRLPMSR